MSILQVELLIGIGAAMGIVFGLFLGISMTKPNYWTRKDSFENLTLGFVARQQRIHVGSLMLAVLGIFITFSKLDQPLQTVVQVFIWLGIITCSVFAFIPSKGFE